MTLGLKTVIFPVTDLDAAKKVFGALLGTPVVDEPYYVQYEAPGQSVGLDPNGHKSGMTGPIGYWHVEDIAGTIKSLLDSGATLVADAKTVGGTRQIATVKDADGNVIGLLQD
ncbi:VOC family protein [Actinocorallia lasiicapitis]